MAITLTKDSIDIGIVVRDGDAALKFYRDTLGFEHPLSTPMPPGGGTMHRLMCGTTMVKLLVLDPIPDAVAPPGGIRGASGYRYFTISVPSVQAMADTCEAAGYKILTAPREIRPGVSIAIVEDPDGNAVEFIQQ